MRSHPRLFSPRRSVRETVGLPAAVLAVSGFVVLVFEVTWTRVPAMTLGPTTYAFSAMLRGGRSGAAEERFSEALFVSPTLAPALNGLAEAREAQKYPTSSEAPAADTT